MDFERHLLVDGYNILNAWPELQKILRSQGSAAANALLLSQLQPLHDQAHIRVTVVFDGKGNTLSIERPSHQNSFSALYTPTGQTADDVIEQLAGAAIEATKLTVATDDRALAETTHSLGCEVISSAILKDWILQSGRLSADFITRYNQGTDQKWKRRHQP